MLFHRQPRSHVVRLQNIVCRYAELVRFPSAQIPSIAARRPPLIMLEFVKGISIAAIGALCVQDRSTSSPICSTNRRSDFTVKWLMW